MAFAFQCERWLFSEPGEVFFPGEFFSGGGDTEMCKANPGRGFQWPCLGQQRISVDPSENFSGFQRN